MAITSASAPAVPKKATKFRWLVLSLIFVIYAITTADRASVGFAMPFIAKEFNLSKTETGALLSLFFFGYAIAQVPAGFVVSKLGVRRVFTGAFLILSAAIATIFLAPSAGFIKWARGAVGMAQAPVANGLMTTINNWFPPKEKGTAAGFYMSSSKFGPLMVPFICAAVIQVASWREIFLVFAAPWVVLLVLWLVFVQNKPADSGFVNDEEAALIADKTAAAKGAGPAAPTRDFPLLDKLILARPVKKIDSKAGVFTSWGVIGSALGFFCIMAMVSVIMNWLPSYLKDVKQFNLATMAIASAAPFAGTVAGNVIGGWISDNLLDKRRKPLMMLTSICSAVMMFSLTYASSNPAILSVHLFLVGCLLSLGYANFVIYPSGLTTKETFPLATALFNTGGQFGAALAPIVVGFLLDNYSWDAVFATLAGASVVSLLVIATVPEPRGELPNA